MQTIDPALYELTLADIRRLIQQPSATAPNNHDLLNALHTVLCSIEMLEMDITKPQKEVFDRLNIGAKHLETQLQAFLKSNGEVKTAIAANIDAVLPSK